MTAAGGTGEAKSATGDLGGFDEGRVVDTVTAGTVDEFPDEGFAHIHSGFSSPRDHILDSTPVQMWRRSTYVALVLHE